MFDEDTENILQGDFSIVVTLKKNDTELETRGIFDKTFVEFNPDTGMTIMSRNPRVSLFENDLLDYFDDVNDDDEWSDWVITINLIEYIAIKPESDGTGIILLYLKKI